MESGQLKMISSAEAAIALRQRLNETVDQLESLRKEHALLEVQFESQSKELTIAKSDRKSCFWLSFNGIILTSLCSQSGEQRSTRYPCYFARIRQ